MIRDYAHAAQLQEAWERANGMHDDCRDLSELAPSYCIAKLAYAAGEDEAGDAAMGRFIEEIDADERDQIEAQLEQDYPGRVAWIACILDEADRLAREEMRRKAKRAVVQFIVAVMA